MRYEQEIRRMEKLLGELEAEKRDSGQDGSSGLTSSLQRTVSSLTDQISGVRLIIYYYSPPQLTCLTAAWPKCWPWEETFEIAIRPRRSDTVIRNSQKKVESRCSIRCPRCLQGDHTKVRFLDFERRSCWSEVCVLVRVRASLTSKSDISFRTYKKKTLLPLNNSNIWSPRTNYCLLRPNNFVEWDCFIWFGIVPQLDLI